MVEEIEKIKEAYEKINLEIDQMPNNEETRQLIHDRLIEEIPFAHKVVCDETNNTPDVIDANNAIAMVVYPRVDNGQTILKCIDLTFGRNIVLQWGIA